MDRKKPRLDQTSTVIGAATLGSVSYFLPKIVTTGLLVYLVFHNDSEDYLRTRIRNICAITGKKLEKMWSDLESC